jgi:GT2 family glycosyltransferase
VPAETDIVVVVPAFKAGSTIDAALASVASQTVAPCEVVVVDDASPDDTADRAARWATVLPVHVYRQRANGGPAAARIRAIDESSAPLIALLDADDVWFPDHLEMLQSAWHATHGLISADAYYWAPGRGIGERARERQRVPAPSEQLHAIVRSNFVFGATLFSRDAYAAVGGFRPAFTGAEDWDLWIRLVRAGVPVVPVSVPTMLYRISPEGLTSQTHIRAAYAAMLEASAHEAASDDERVIAEATAQRLRARHHLELAQAAARRGDRGALRAEARRARDAGGRVALEAAGLVLAPQLVLMATDAVRRITSERSIGRDRRTSARTRLPFGRG